MEWDPDTGAKEATRNIYMDTSGSKGLGGTFEDHWFSARCPVNSTVATSNSKKYTRYYKQSFDGATYGNTITLYSM